MSSVCDLFVTMDWSTDSACLCSQVCNDPRSTPDTELDSIHPHRLPIRCYHALLFIDVILSSAPLALILFCSSILIPVTIVQLHVRTVYLLTV